MLPSQAPKYYLAGVLLSALGTLVLALRGRRRGAPIPRSWKAIAVGIVLLASGIAVIGIGISVDMAYNAGFSTTVMSYRVSLRMNGSWPIRILLPAPSDARLYDALNATNGSASLRLNHTSTETNVVLVAQGNVTFQIRTQVPSAAIGRDFTRLAPCGLSSAGYECNATIELRGAPAGMKLLLTLMASIGVVCESHLLSIVSWIGEGVAEYPAWTPTVVC